VWYTSTRQSTFLADIQSWEVFPSYTFECFNRNLQLYSERVPFVSDWMQITVQGLQVSLAYKVHGHVIVQQMNAGGCKAYHLPIKSQGKNQYSFRIIH